MTIGHRIARFFAPDIFNALARAFPDFDDDPAMITPERIKRVGEAHLAMIMDNGPTEIDFTDQEGVMRRIVHDSGDWEAGIPSGWTIEDGDDWGAFPLNERGEPKYPVREPVQAHPDKAHDGAET